MLKASLAMLATLNEKQVNSNMHKIQSMRV